MHKNIRIIALIISTIIVISTLWYFYSTKTVDQEMKNTFTLTSPSFKDGHAIPNKHSCGGKNISPELAWSGVPAGTQSFALIVDDPDAAQFNDGKTFYHWAIINIPASKKGLEEHALISLPTIQLANDYSSEEPNKDHKKYDGPCPPKGSGPHHYRFTVYALDQDVPVGETHKVSDLERYVQSHNIGMAQLVGVYER